MRNFAIATLALAAATAAHAQAGQVTASNPQSLVAALQSGGYRAELTKDSQGDPMIKSGASGSTVTILFYGCTKNVRCTNVQFYAGFNDSKPSLDIINAWNRDHRYGRAYMDKVGDPVVEWDVDLDPDGVSRAVFVDNFKAFEGALASFKQVLP